MRLRRRWCYSAMGRWECARCLRHWRRALPTVRHVLAGRRACRI